MRASYNILVQFFNKILVPIDGSKQSYKALDSALEIAQMSGAEITVFHIIPKTSEVGPRTKRLDSQLKSQATALMEQALTQAKKKKIEIKSKIARGSPAHEIIKFSKGGEYDHIVMSSTGTGSAQGDMLGSVSSYVLHRSKIPVYLIK